MLIVEMQPVDALLDKAQASTRFSLLLIGVFAVIAALLAAIGLYGVLATIVRQRTAETGIRMALGAQPARIFGLVVGQALRPAGIAAGLATAFALTREMNTMLVGIKARRPIPQLLPQSRFFSFLLPSSHPGCPLGVRRVSTPLRLFATNDDHICGASLHGTRPWFPLTIRPLPAKTLGPVTPERNRISAKLIWQRNPLLRLRRLSDLVQYRTADVSYLRLTQLEAPDNRSMAASTSETPGGIPASRPT